MGCMRIAEAVDSVRTHGKPDAVCAAAVDVARQAAVDVGGESVGEHQAVHAEGDRLVTQLFAANVPGYAGWFWSVAVTRAPRSRSVDGGRGGVAARSGRAAGACRGCRGASGCVQGISARGISYRPIRTTHA